MSVATELQRIIDAKADLKTAIEAKGVTVSSDVLIDDYPALVDAIPTGGGAEAEEKLLNFIDFDGTIVASFDGSEIAGLTALPDAPDHSSDEAPLTFDEWNWTLTEIQNYHTSYPDDVIWVGATYHTTDNKTHLFYNVSSDNDGYGVRFVADDGGTVDWGDNSSTESFSSGEITHIYTSAGIYHCVIDGTMTKITIGSSGNTNTGRSSKLIKARFASTIKTFDSYAFYYCYNLQDVSFPSGTLVFGGIYTFQGCVSLKSIVVPKRHGGGDISIPNYAFTGCSSLNHISFSLARNNVMTISGDAFSGCSNLKSITIQGLLTLSSTLGSKAFQNCASLNKVLLPNTTSLPDRLFQTCNSLQTITIPSSVTSITNYTLYSCYSLYSIVMKGTTPPSLSTLSLTTDYLKKIYVPYSADHSVLTAYQNATNWSNYASIMEELPE